MEILTFLAADHANLAVGGKVNVMGIFDRFISREFPVRHPMFHIVLKVELSLGEKIQDRNMKILLYDEDRSKNLVLMDKNITFNQTIPGDLPAHTAIVGIQDMIFPVPGTYECVVYIDEEELPKVLPLRVIKIEDEN